MRGEKDQGKGSVRLKFGFETKERGRVQRYRIGFRLEFPAGAPLRVHHQAMPRLHRRMTLAATQRMGEAGLERTRFTTPGNYELPCGRQDMMLHPALVVFQPGGAAWLAGPLTQRRANAGYTWRLIDDRTIEVTAEFAPLGLPGWEMSAGEVFEGEELYVQESAGPVEFGPAVFEGYHAALSASGLGRAGHGALERHEVFWGTWNEGNYRRIDEAFILREARWIAKNLPNVKWIQIDDGYQSDADEAQCSARFGLADLGAHATDAGAWCRRRFPHGMRALANDIRALGLRPMIWFSPACLVNRELHVKRPELFIPDARLHFVPELAFPDFSLPEVRDLARQALDRLFVEWGFEGVKLDFWSYQFLQERLALRKEGATNLEWMAWLEREIRARIGPEGLMLSCLEPANGDPFRSSVWDMYRVGPDIDGGIKIELLEEIAVWIASLNGLKQIQRRFWMPDGDSLSLFRFAKTPDPFWRLITTMFVVSGAAAEIAGRLSEEETDVRMPSFRRAVAAIRHGQELICPVYDWSENGGRAPRVWVRKDSDGRRVLGFTNWNTKPEVADMRVDAADVDAAPETFFENIFTGERTAAPWCRRVPAGDAELWVQTEPGEMGG